MKRSKEEIVADVQDRVAEFTAVAVPAAQEKAAQIAAVAVPAAQNAVEVATPVVQNVVAGVKRFIKIHL